MNWRRGLFRLWIVGSVLFVIAVAVISYSEIKEQFDDWEVAVPMLCANARGAAGEDYAEISGNCLYGMSKFRPLYPEYNDLSDNELARKLYTARGMEFHDRPNRWTTLGTWAAIAFGIPLVVLVLGSSLVWAFSGFAATRN